MTGFGLHCLPCLVRGHQYHGIKTKEASAFLSL